MKTLFANLVFIAAALVGTHSAQASGGMAPVGEYVSQQTLADAYDSYFLFGSQATSSSQMFHLYESGAQYTDIVSRPGEEPSRHSTLASHRSESFAHSAVELTWISDTQVQMRFNGPETSRIFSQTPLPEVVITGTLAGGHTRNELEAATTVDIQVSPTDLAAADDIFANYLSQKTVQEFQSQNQAHPELVIDAVTVDFKSTRFGVGTRGFVHEFSSQITLTAKVTKETQSNSKNP